MKHSELCPAEQFLPGMDEVTDCVETLARSDPSSEGWKRSREKVDGIAAALAAGATYRAIEKSFSVSHRTISKVKALHPELIEQGRKRLAAKFGSLADICVDTLTEKAMAGQIPVNILGMIAGTAVDKANILENRPTQITEKVERGQDEINRLRADLAALQKGETGLIIDVSPGND